MKGDADGGNLRPDQRSREQDVEAGRRSFTTRSSSLPGAPRALVTSNEEVHDPSCRSLISKYLRCSRLVSRRQAHHLRKLVHHLRGRNLPGVSAHRAASRFIVLPRFSSPSCILLADSDITPNSSAEGRIERQSSAPSAHAVDSNDSNDSFPPSHGMAEHNAITGDAADPGTRRSLTERAISQSLRPLRGSDP